MSQWISLGSLDQFEADTATEVIAESLILAVYQVEGKYYVIDGICSHQGGPIGRGQMCGHIVTCPWHGWQYDVRSGKHELSNIHQQSYPVELRAGELFINIANESDE